MNDIPIFNKNILDQLSRELGAEDTAEVLRTFISDTANKMLAITAEGLSRSAVKREAHSIKSSAATFGFERLSVLARDLEFGAERMDAGLMAMWLKMIRQVFEETTLLANNELLVGIGEISS